MAEVRQADGQPLKDMKKKDETRISPDLAELITLIRKKGFDIEVTKCVNWKGEYLCMAITKDKKTVVGVERA